THQMITVYKTVRNPDIAYALRKACADKPVDWLVFFSPSGVEFCLDFLPKANAKFAAIGPTTAQKLRDCGVVVSAVAATPNPDGLIKAVLSVSNSNE
ncbi:uroporphyrinogen-III synthase, partial [Sphaeroforma arctica JP610]